MVFVAPERQTYNTVYDFDISPNNIEESIDEEVPIFEMNRLRQSHRGIRNKTAALRQAQ